MSSTRTAIRAARAASWAYALLVVAVCGFLCLFIVMPGQLFLLFATGLPDTASIRIIRGYGDLWRPGNWNQAVQTQWGADTSALRAASRPGTGDWTQPQPGRPSDSEVHSSNSSTSEAVQPVPTSTSPSHTYPLPAPEATMPVAVDGTALDEAPSDPGALVDASQIIPAPPDDADAPEAPITYVSEFVTIEEDSAAPQGAVGLQTDSTDSVSTADMVSALLENRSLSPAPSTPWLMDVEVRKSPAQWQEEYLRLYTGDEDINFQSSGHVSPWFGDFMEPGTTPCTSSSAIS